ncbi:unnamed protein product [Rotaria socialis]|uniref:Uncharacterized protein n=1 Tax=Rotaria socialis TaxID=392032 RepID=A0A818P9R4_9BILA|nr:unnamed protein product [Rotaria socialis]CAF3368160.1 unnamed protein product [Rotaria socialis]CAF3398523.1 unnamed protein product [Rotaria socialis]CAF3620827.1 unnamed protein product [Rotaria socialis]CAF3802107.1 unnamed protein product [Rotaria socialis]
MSRAAPEYYFTSNDIASEHNSRLKNYLQTLSNKKRSILNRKSKRQYNIIEKDLDNHKVYYYVPVEYGNNYDLSQLDEEPIDEVRKRSYSPRLVRRRNFEPYNDNYPEKLPMISSRPHNYVSPRRPHVIQRTYYEPSPSQTSEYINENDHRPRNEELYEYVVRERMPRQRHIVESHPFYHTTQGENLHSVSRSPHHVDNSNRLSPRALPSASQIIPLHLNELLSSRRSKMKQQASQRTRTIHESLNRSLVQKTNEHKHFYLKDILAQNRARRGSRILPPRREIDEEELHEKPLGNRDFIKNDLLVHK